MSKMFQEAIRRDVAGHCSEAIKHYEAEIAKNKSAPADAFINLTFIYWSLAFEPPFTFDEGVSDRWSLFAGSRYPVILEMGINRYDGNLELHFWEKYFPYRGLGEEFSRNDCEVMIQNYSSKISLVPYFFLWLFDNDLYAKERQELLEQVRSLPIMKNRYIESILETPVKSNR